MFKRIHFRLDLQSLVLLLAITIVLPGMVFAKGNSDEALYRKLSYLATSQAVRSRPPGGP